MLNGYPINLNKILVIELSYPFIKLKSVLAYRQFSSKREASYQLFRFNKKLRIGWRKEESLPDCRTCQGFLPESHGIHMQLLHRIQSLSKGNLPWLSRSRNTYFIRNLARYQEDNIPR